MLFIFFFILYSSGLNNLIPVNVSTWAVQGSLNTSNLGLNHINLSHVLISKKSEDFFRIWNKKFDLSG